MLNRLIVFALSRGLVLGYAVPLSATAQRLIAIPPGSFRFFIPYSYAAMFVHAQAEHQQASIVFRPSQ